MHERRGIIEELPESVFATDFTQEGTVSETQRNFVSLVPQLREEFVNNGDLVLAQEVSYQAVSRYPILETHDFYLAPTRPIQNQHELQALLDQCTQGPPTYRKPFYADLGSERFMIGVQQHEDIMGEVRSVQDIETIIFDASALTHKSVHPEPQYLKKRTQLKRLITLHMYPDKDLAHLVGAYRQAIVALEAEERTLADGDIETLSYTIEPEIEKRVRYRLDQLGGVDAYIKHLIDGTLVTNDNPEHSATQAILNRVTQQYMNGRISLDEKSRIDNHIKYPLFRHGKKPQSLTKILRPSPVLNP